MKKSEIDIINRINAYQYNKYIKPTLKEKKVMQIKDIRIECNTCKVYFTPSNERSKTLMETQGHISKCKTCFEEGGE
tara:strand:- start:14934 stop:15164 length:231 start_codon:yes stop_codon:yes gene_type:complete